MSIEYLGLSSINGPLIALEGVQGAFFDEIVEFVIGGSERKIGRIIELITLFLITISFYNSGRSSRPEPL